MQTTPTSITATAPTTAAKPARRISAADKAQLRKLQQRGLRVTVVERNLSDGSQVYSVQLVDRDENSAITLAELDCINEPKARRLREDICDSLRHNSVVQIID